MKLSGAARVISFLVIALPLAAAQDRGFSFPDAGAGGKRVALVIGNAAYTRSPLVNPVNDATDIGSVLSGRFGFETAVVTNANLQAMDQAIEKYLAQLSPGDVALFYYSGHGMQVGGENYLLPVDFAAADEFDVKYKAYSASRLGDRLRGRGVRLSILILDACRDNPYRSWRSESGKGLAGMGGAGSYIAFAAAEGKTADDNPRERNGLFTKYLLASLKTTGLTLDEVFNRVREGVYRESQGRQTPFTYSGVVGVFRFDTAPAPAGLDMDLERYNAVRDSRDPAQLEAVASRIGRADLAEILRERARALRSVAGPLPSPAIAAPKLTQQEIDAANGRADSAYELKDYATAAPLYGQSAENGSTRAMVRLGYMYETGQGLPPDQNQAVYWYRKAAEVGNPAGMYDLGLQYMSGSGVARDYAQAAAWFRKAADAGYSGGMYELGLIYANGRGVAEDNTQAAAWYRKGADAGDSDSMNNLAVLYENGRGLQKDLEQAISWYRKAAALGNEVAKGNLKRLGR